MKEEAPARITPYEFVFGPELEERFAGIQQEAEGRGERLVSPAGFLLLGDVGALLQDLLPEDDPAAPAAVGEYGLLLYHAFQFWRFGRPILVLEQEAARGLANLPRPIGRWDLVPPEPAGYLQLPRNLFWAKVGPDAAPEPVDGIFWAAIGDEDPKIPPFRRLDLVLILGVRRDRPGFSIVPVHEVWPAGGEGHWGDAMARADGADFENTLPGGEIDRLLAFTTPLEALKLVSRVFWYLAETVPDDAIREVAAAGSAAAPDATGLAHRVIRWRDPHG